jgi:hypothetical protein
MQSVIETLEGRTLYAAHFGGGGFGSAALIARAEASTDPAVQDTLALVKTDAAAVTAARDALKTDAADTRPAVRDAVRAGNELLATDRQAVFTAKFSGDAAAFDAAKAKLKADRAQVRADVAAARNALADDTADTRDTLKSATQSLREHLKQLRTDLGVTTNAMQRLTVANTGTAAAPLTTATGDPASSDEVNGVIDRIRDVANGATEPDHALVNTLLDHLSAALDDRELTDAERQQLRDDTRAVLDSANISRDTLRGIGQDIRDIVRDSNLRWGDLLNVASDMVSVMAP